MKKFDLFFAGLFFSCALITSCNRSEEAIEPETTTPVFQETLQGEEGAVAALNEFLDDFFARPETRSESRPAVSGVHATNTATYGESPATRSEEDGMPVYEIALQNGDDTEGFAVVVENRNLYDVLAYVPAGSIADTAFNFGMADWFHGLYALGKQPESGTSTRADVWQEDWDWFILKKIIGTQEFLGMRTWAEINAIPSSYGAIDHVVQNGPLLRTEWSQTAPYNNRAPYYRDDKGVLQKCRVGCFAVAVGQVMAYHKHGADYNWNLLTASPTISASNTTAANEVSRLLSGIATVGGTTYDLKKGAGSTYNGQEIPTLAHFGYNATYYTSGITLPTVYDEILASGPVIIEAQAGAWNDRLNWVGHFWVVDGTYLFERWYYSYAKVTSYTSSGSTVGYELWRVRARGRLLHCNWGWGGLSNGWYYDYSPVYTDGRSYYFGHEIHLVSGISIK